MGRRLTDEALRCLTLFESVAPADAVDCVIDDRFDRIAIVVAEGQLADAIGPDGRTVRSFERRLGRSVSLVEMADTPEDFVANALRPAAVYGVEIDEENGRIAVVDVAEDDRGAAIGRDGRTIELARTLAARLFDVDDVRLADGAQPPEGDV